MDPLSVLRQFAVEARLDSVRVEGGVVAVGDPYSFTTRALTRFKGAAGQLLALESAVLFAKHFPLGAAAYVKACQAAGTVPVPVADRRPLRDFLSGSNEASALARLVDVAEVPVVLEEDGAGGAAGAAAGAAGAAPSALAAPASALEQQQAPMAAAAAAAAEEQAALRLLDAVAAVGEADAVAADGSARAAKRARLDATTAAPAATTAAAAAAPPPTTAPPVDAAMAKALRLLAGQERQLRDRNTMLLAPNRAFGRVLQIAEREEAERKRRDAERAQERAAQERQQQQQQQAARPRPSAIASQQQQPRPRQPQHDPNAFIKASGRFEREDAAAGTLRAMAGAVGAGDGGAAGGAAGLLAADVGLGYGGAQEEQQRQQQQQQQQRAAAPRPAQPPPPPRPRAPAAAATPSSRAPSSSSGAVPIIIVPAAMSAMLNMWNARQFFEQGKYLPSAEAYKQNPAREAAVLSFKRAALRTNPPLPTYHVTDVVPPAKSPDWQRVVAVVVQGKPWQFRDWPFKGAAQGGESDC
jgi:parafibromin